MTVAVCGAAGSTTCTVSMVLSTRGCKLPSEIDSMSVRFRCLYQVDGKTVARDRRRRLPMHLSGWLVDRPATVGLLLKTQTAPEEQCCPRTDRYKQEQSFVIEESRLSIHGSGQTNTFEGHLGLLFSGTDTTHGMALAVNLRSV